MECFDIDVARMTADCDAIAQQVDRYHAATGTVSFPQDDVYRLMGQNAFADETVVMLSDPEQVAQAEKLLRDLHRGIELFGFVDWFMTRTLPLEKPENVAPGAPPIIENAIKSQEFCRMSANILLRYASMNPLCLRTIQELLENRLLDVVCLLAPYSGIPSLAESLETIGKALRLADPNVRRNGMADAKTDASKQGRGNHDDALGTPFELMQGLYASDADAIVARLDESGRNRNGRKPRYDDIPGARRNLFCYMPNDASYETLMSLTGLPITAVADVFDPDAKTDEAEYASYLSYLASMVREYGRIVSEESLLALPLRVIEAVDDTIHFSTGMPMPDEVKNLRNCFTCMATIMVSRIPDPSYAVLLAFDLLGMQAEQYARHATQCLHDMRGGTSRTSNAEEEQ